MTEIQDEDFLPALYLLPRVLTLIASTDYEISDDTFLEKLLSWFQSSLRDKDKLYHVLNSSTLKFLSSVSSPDEDCSSSCLSFALKLLPTLVISISKHSQERQVTEISAPAEVTETVCKVLSLSVPCSTHDQISISNRSIRNADTPAVEGQDGYTLHKELVKIGSNMLKKSLRSHWEDVSIRNSWILAATRLMDESSWKLVLHEIGVFNKAIELLKDQSMFVVKAAQLFLAKIISSSDIAKGNLKQKVHYTADSSNAPSTKENHANGYVQEANQSCQVKVENVMMSEAGTMGTDVQNSQVLSMKRKLSKAKSDFHEDKPAKVTKILHPETVLSLNQTQHETDASIKQWKNSVMQFILGSGNSLSPGKNNKLATNQQICLDHDMSASTGILCCLLELSPHIGVNLIAENSLIQQYCSILQHKDRRSVTTEAVLPLLCLYLEKSTELLSLPDDTLWFQINAIMRMMHQQLLKTRKLNHFSQLIPALLRLCNKKDHMKCLPVNVRKEVKMLMSIFMVSLRVSLEDINQSPIQENQAFAPEIVPLFQSMTKQDLFLMKYYSLLCMERIILEESLHLAVGSTELLEVLYVLIGWISVQHLAFLKQNVNRFLKQYLDVVKAMQEKDAEPSLFLPIMHSVLQLISSSDCDNIVLNKGLHLLKFHFLTGKTGCLLNDHQELMTKARDVLQKHLLSLQWEARDSAINFLGTVLETSDGTITNWIKQTKLHHHIWERLEDEESYVREASLNALDKLSCNQTLWKEFMECYDIKEIDIIKKVTTILMKDHGGFARRAAINLLCSWIKEGNWMRSSLLLSPQWKSDKTIATEENCVSIPGMVFCSVTAASRDLDWEVKLSSLEFWGEFLQAVIPEFILPPVTEDKDDSKSNHSKGDNWKSDNCFVGNFENTRNVERAVSGEGNELSCEIPQYASMFEGFGNPSYSFNENIPCVSNSIKRIQHLRSTNMKGTAGHVSWTEVLDGHVCLQLLFEKLEDEDRTVCYRACEILLSLKAHLSKLLGEYDVREAKCRENDGISQLKQILSLIAEHEIEEVLYGCLEGSNEKMSSLLEEILSAANVSDEKKINIDCY